MSGEISKFFEMLHPVLKIPDKHRQTWDKTERRSFTTGARIFFFVYCLGYLIHFCSVDIPLKKVPLELWAEYRFGCSILGILGFSLTYTRWFKVSQFYKVPAGTFGVICTFLQAQSMTWRP